MKISEATSPSNPRVYFDIEINNKPQGRIVMELFKNVTPRCAENFRQLCTGESGKKSQNGKPLNYKGSIFHRVIREFMMQGGDFTHFSGQGGESIYGKTFPDENFKLKHEIRGLLSMANAGKNTNGSQFFITFVPTPHLNGKHTVFGRVESGYDICQKIEKLKVKSTDKPFETVRIASCGEIKKEVKEQRAPEKAAEQEPVRSSKHEEEKQSHKVNPEEKRRVERSRSRDREEKHTDKVREQIKETKETKHRRDS